MQHTAEARTGHTHNNIQSSKSISTYIAIFNHTPRKGSSSSRQPRYLDCGVIRRGGQHVWVIGAILHVKNGLRVSRGGLMLHLSRLHVKHAHRAILERAQHLRGAFQQRDTHKPYFAHTDQLQRVSARQNVETSQLR